MPIALVGAIVTLFAALLFARSRSAAGGIVIIGGLFVLMQFLLGGYYRDHLYLDRSTARWNTQQIDKGLRFIRDYGITDKPVVWLGRVEQQPIEAGVFQSLVRCGFSINFPDKFPDSTLQWQPPLSPGQLLIVMSNPKKYPRIEDALAKEGVTIERAKSEDIADGLEITIGRIQTVTPNIDQ